MNDILRYDEVLNEWQDVSPTTGDAPAPRSGHVQVCFYNYVLVFGGQGEGGFIFDDLWVYDVIKQDWHMLMDASRTHELQKNGVTGLIPSGRVDATITLFEDYGAAVMIGGLLKSGVAACDAWVIDLDTILNFVENPTKYKQENVWIKKDL